MNWNSDWERSGPSCIMSSLWQPFVSGVADSSRSVTRVLYTVSYHVSPHAVINSIQTWRTQMPQLRWDKFWSFCNNSTVAHVQWAFQVLQSSIATIFKCTKFHQNRPSIIKDITKNMLVSFFLDTVVVVHCESKKLGHFYFKITVNFVKCWPILIILSLSEPEIISAVI